MTTQEFYDMWLKVHWLGYVSGSTKSYFSTVAEVKRLTDMAMELGEDYIKITETFIAWQKSASGFMRKAMPKLENIL